MEKALFEAYWETTTATYRKGTSEFTNALTEENFDKFVKIFMDKLKPECPNCGNKMSYYGISFECKCGMLKTIT